MTDKSIRMRELKLELSCCYDNERQKELRMEIGKIDFDCLSCKGVIRAIDAAGGDSYLARHDYKFLLSTWLSRRLKANFKRTGRQWVLIRYNPLRGDVFEHQIPAHSDYYRRILGHSGWGNFAVSAPGVLLVVNNSTGNREATFSATNIVRKIAEITGDQLLYEKLLA